MITGKKILVTGGVGFIGSHLCETLKKAGNDVIAFDNCCITKNNVDILTKLGVEIFEGDITNYDSVTKAMSGVNMVFHLAAMNRAMKSVKDPLQANEINITGTLHVLEAARQAGVTTFVNISSSSVYGETPEFPRKETNTLDPTHPYAVGKLSAEYYTKVYHTLYGMDTVSVRFFSVYGPRQLGSISYAAVIPKFIMKITDGEEIEIYGDGDQKRNFTYVADVVEYTIRAASTPQAVGEVFNISSEEEITVNGLVTKLGALLNIKPNVKHTPALKGEIRENPADISKAKKY